MRNSSKTNTNTTDQGRLFIVLALIVLMVGLFAMTSVNKVRAAANLAAGCYTKSGTTFTAATCRDAIQTSGVSSGKCYQLSGGPAYGGGSILDFEIVCSTGLLVTNSGGNSPSSPSCGSPDACERAVVACTNNGGIWDGARGTCDMRKKNCETSGGTWTQVGALAPNAQSYTCSCQEPKTNTAGICVAPELDTDPGADVGGDKSGDCTDSSLTVENCGILGYIVDAINVLSAAAGVIMITMIIVGGIQYASGFGATDKDPMAVGAAKRKISNAVFALFVYTFFYAFLNWIIPGGLL